MRDRQILQMEVTKVSAFLDRAACQESAQKPSGFMQTLCSQRLWRQQSSTTFVVISVHSQADSSRRTLEI